MMNIVRDFGNRDVNYFTGDSLPLRVAMFKT